MSGYELGSLTAVSAFKDFPGDPAYCPAARELVRTALKDHQRIVDDAELVVSELFANGCRHTHSGEGGTLSVSVSALVTGLAVISVTDQGPRSDDHEAAHGREPRLNPADPATSGWRGLHLITEVADDWGYDENEDEGFTVWAVFESPALAPSHLLG